MKRPDPLKKVKELGEELYLLRKQINDVEEAARLAVEPLKARKDELTREVIAGFKAIDLTSIKVKSGDTIAVVSKQSYAIMNPIHALAWAKENGAVRIDSVMLKQKLEQTDPATLPPHVFAPVVDEYISVRKPAAKKEHADPFNEPV